MKQRTEQSKGQELLHTLITRAWEDKAFKKELIASPEKAIENLTGKSVTNTNKKVFVVDQSNPDHVYINIPANPQVGDQELTEDQLEAVAGGTTVIDTVIDAVDTVLDWLRAV